MFKLGDKNIQALKLGGNDVAKVYLGDEVIFELLTGKQFGVEWDQSTDTLTRLNDSIGLNGGSDFTVLGNDGVWQLRRCMVNDNKSINYYIDPSDPTKIGEVVNTQYITGNTADYTGADGQVMVEIPKFYWKTAEPTTGVYQWWVSPIEFDNNYEVHPVFITNNQTKDFIYIGAFEATSATSTGVLRSISGVQPRSTRTIVQFRNQAQTRGTGWQLQTYWAIHALQMLYLIEYADFDVQTTIGRGIVDKASSSVNSSNTTGRTIFLGNESGREAGTDGLTAVSYRGVENLWGNIANFVDGININSSNIVFVANENFASNVFTGSYTSIGSITSGNDFISNIQFPHFLATEVNGSDTSFLHDSFAGQGTTNRVALFGFGWSNTTVAGLYAWNLTWSSSSSFYFMGTRLQIL